MTILKRPFQLLVLVLLLVVLVMGVWVFHLIRQRNILTSLNLNKQQQRSAVESLAKATLLSSSKSLKQGSEFVVDLMVDSQDVLVNVFSLELNFPPEELQFIGFNTAGSLASVWFEKRIEQNGKIFLTAGKPAPGFKGQGKLVELRFRALQPGKAEVSFAASSAIYRNQDNKNILGQTENIQFTITP